MKHFLYKLIGQRDALFKETGQFWQKGSLVLMALVFGKLISFLWKIVLARTGIQTLGAVEVFLNIFTVLTSLSLLSLHSSLQRFISIYRAKEDRAAAARLLLFTILLGTTMALGVASVFTVLPNGLRVLLGTNVEQTTRVAPYLWALPFFVVNEIFWNFLNAWRKISRYALGKYISLPLLRLFFLFLLLMVGVPLPTLIVSHLVLAGMVATLVTFPYVQPFLTSGIRLPDFPLLKQYVLFTLPMGGSFIIFAAYGVLDVLLLNKYTSVQIVGLFAAATMLSDVTDIVFLPFLNIFQTFLGTYHQNLARGLNFTAKIMALLLTAGIGVGTGIFALQNFFIHLLGGSTYTGIATYLGFLLILKVVHSAFVLPLRHFLDFYGHVRITLVLMGVAFAVKWGTGLWLIPRLGISGVVAMQAISIAVHLVGCIGCTFWLYRTSKTSTAKSRGLISD